MRNEACVPLIFVSIHFNLSLVSLSWSFSRFLSLIVKRPRTNETRHEWSEKRENTRSFIPFTRLFFSFSFHSFLFLLLGCGKRNEIKRMKSNGMWTKWNEARFHSLYLHLLFHHYYLDSRVKRAEWTKWVKWDEW